MMEDYECDDLRLMASKYKKDKDAKANVCDVFNAKGCCTGEEDECC